MAIRDRSTLYGKLRHGHCSNRKRTKVYITWHNMLTRCQDPGNRGYPRYGGRGIKVCDRWQKFENFYADMGDQPPGLMIDRLDNDGDYCPENCAWHGIKEQLANRHNTVRLTFDGKTLTLLEWSRRTGLTAKRIYDRIRRGFSVERALTFPFQKHASHKRSHG